MADPQPHSVKARTAAQAIRVIAASIPLLLASGCGSNAPYVTTVGALRPQTTLRVRVGSATVNAYAPEASQRRNLFTIAATALPHGTPPPPPFIRPIAGGIEVDATAALYSLLVRVPDRSNIVVRSRSGDVNVTDIAGNADVATDNGNVTVMLDGYAQAAAGNGNVVVTMGSVRWPGTLHFSTGRGDITVTINPKVACAVHLHTADGTLFTDFGLRGTANGHSETIDGVLGGGGEQRIDIDATRGSIRLLSLRPQA